MTLPILNYRWTLFKGPGITALVLIRNCWHSQWCTSLDGLLKCLPGRAGICLWRERIIIRKALWNDHVVSFMLMAPVCCVGSRDHDCPSSGCMLCSNSAWFTWLLLRCGMLCKVPHIPWSSERGAEMPMNCRRKGIVPGSILLSV